MVITVGPELEAALREVASRRGMAPDVLAENFLKERFLADPALQPRDEWERGLLAAARDCGVSLSNEALSDGLHENDDGTLSGEQSVELERRLSDSIARPEEVTPWEAIKARALARARQ